MSDPSIVGIGIIGHRPNRLAAGETRRVAAECRDVLALVVAIAEDLLPPARVRVISAVAEGADRIGAAAGLGLGCSLQCLLPFAAGEYAHDFPSDASRAEYRTLLARAASVIELDGDRAAADEAYERAGRAILSRSDLLLTVWDGGPAAGRGGTPQMIEEALDRAVPVVWINAAAPVAPLLLEKGAPEAPIDRLRLLLPARLRCSPGRGGRPPPG
jgi:hypothetical protein